MNRFAQLVATAAAFGAVAVLGIVVFNVIQRAIPALNLDLFTQVQATFGESGGGIKNAIVGSVIIVGLATLVAVPIGVMVAIYVSEFAHEQVRRYVRLALDVLNGVPSIVIGIFVYALLVVGSGQAAWKASFALAVIMLPLVSRTTIEVLDLVPSSLARGQLRPRRGQVADGAVRHPPDRARRDPHGLDPGDRARRRRDGAAPVHDVDLPERRRHRPASGDGTRFRSRSSSTRSRRTRR